MQINGVQFVLYIFFGPETRYFVSDGTDNCTTVQKEYWSFGRKLGPHALTLKDFYTPVLLARIPSVLLPTIAYSMVFAFCGVMLTVEIPQVFAEKFHFNAQQLGLQFIPIIIGSIIGEQAGGPLSDWLRMRYIKAKGHAPPPENRLWVSYFGFLTAIVGLIVFGVRIQQASSTWNVTPLIGVGIAAFGNQVITTVLVTYAVDCNPEHSASIGVTVNLIRSTCKLPRPLWGFYPGKESMVGTVGLTSLVPRGLHHPILVPRRLHQHRDDW